MSEDSKDEAQVNRLLMRLGDLASDIHDLQDDVGKAEQVLADAKRDLSRAETEFRNAHAELIKIEPMFNLLTQVAPEFRPRDLPDVELD